MSIKESIYRQTNMKQPLTSDPRGRDGKTTVAGYEAQTFEFVVTVRRTFNSSSSTLDYLSRTPIVSPLDPTQDRDSGDTVTIIRSRNTKS